MKTLRLASYLNAARMTAALAVITVAPLQLVCGQAADARLHGATVEYQLPYGSAPNQTYRVTLAIVEAKKPDWIISTFVSGAPRTVTPANKGRFTEVWNGLDDNFMPVPPGRYAVKGIYMPAQQWFVDGQYHSIVPQFTSGAYSWLSPGAPNSKIPAPFMGDPVGSPLSGVAIGANGIAVLYYQYLENGWNNYLVDLKKSIGPDQAVRGFPSGGVAGGSATTTDGFTVWSFGGDVGPKLVYRADGKRFGSGPGASRSDTSYHPQGWVTSLANWGDSNAGQSVVYAAERGRIVTSPADKRFTIESNSEQVDKVTALDGNTGKMLAQIPLSHPLSLAIQGNTLYALHSEKGSFRVRAMALSKGLLAQQWRELFAVPETIKPAALAADSRGMLYVSDKSSNQVIKFDEQGRIILRIGEPGEQTPGAYNRMQMMSPGKLAAWTDAAGVDRLLVVEDAGPNRLSEWTPDGKMSREWQPLQTHANEGYAADPQNPDLIYIQGQQNWLIRYKGALKGNTWTPDAVWPNVGNDPLSPNIGSPRLLRYGSDVFLACGRSFNLYRISKGRCTLSAAIIRDGSAKGSPKFYFWHDANGDGKVERDEYLQTPAQMPDNLWTYWGQRWLSDLSLVAFERDGRAVWRLVPSSFDSFGNPIFKNWNKLFSDSVFEAKASGGADAVHGGNELDTSYSSDWTQVDGTIGEGFYVIARGGKNFSANYGAQDKLSYYAPAKNGGYELKWRVGRVALQGIAQTGEIYESMQVRKPLGGLISIVDQSRCGVVLYTSDGLYVDTLFPDSKVVNVAHAGIYDLPIEFFAGDIFSDPNTGRIYFGMGKETPLLFEASGWTIHSNPVRLLNFVDSTVTLRSANVASPLEAALALRGGPGDARIARIAPATGGVALDGSMQGWESTSPNVFSSGDKNSVEARCAYDPNHFYIRWHVRTPGKFTPAALDPVDRIFTHDRLSDTVSLYFQGDPNAEPGGPADGRPGDLRFVFGLFQNGGKTVPAVLGMYSKATSGIVPRPDLYESAVGRVEFARVAPVDGAQLGYRMDDDGAGFVLAAAIPRSAFPGGLTFTGGLSTYIDFEATLQGHDKFWWANSDGSASRETFDEPTEARLYPGAWAPAKFASIEDGLIVRNWMVVGPFGGPGVERFNFDGYADKNLARTFFLNAHYPPDQHVDLAASYSGTAIQGYWPDPHDEHWRSQQTLDAADPILKLGNCAQTWYANTWIYSPDRMQLTATLFSSEMADVSLSVNHARLTTPAGKAVPERPQIFQSPFALSLRTGWNELTARGTCVGYPPLRTGLVLDGPAENLWKLRLSSTPGGPNQ